MAEIHSFNSHSEKNISLEYQINSMRMEMIDLKSDNENLITKS